MRRRTFTRLLGAGAAAAALPAPAIARPVKIRWWYHFDRPENTPAELVARFQKANPDIEVEAQSIPWGGGTDYYNRLFAALAAGNPPDCAMLKLANQAQLLEMGALVPLDDFLRGWPGRGDIGEDLWRITRAADGRHYYLPVQYVVLYLYYRADLFAKAGLAPPATFEAFLAAAQTFTKDGMWGFGMRGGAGGHDNWGPFVLGGGASFAKGGMVTAKALAANRWYAELATRHKVTPPSAPTDAFRQIVDGFKAGRTAMIVHHVGSAKEIVEALGDRVSAAPVPKGPERGWTLLGDESNGVFAASAHREAAFRWIAFLSEGEGNALFNKLSGQLPVAGRAAEGFDLHPARFLEASRASLPLAAVLPDSPKTGDFVRTVWPTNMQQVLLGQKSPDEMMRAIEAHFHG